MNPEEVSEAGQRRDVLLRYGYVEVPEISGIRTGGRAWHSGQQWARPSVGTAVVLHVLHKPESSWSMSWNLPDVELVVLRDAPFLPGMSRVTDWPGHHTYGVTP